ncbi:MAG: helix-turn-helix domain-containing protein [Planctomycetes bacterium]|nr:helix-turn-helix domain-containing protein [Planctomycetota bacterium]
MASKFLTVDEAAKQLGISAEKLTELREKQMVRAFRDGASWKFKADDIERLATERAEAEDDSSDSAEVILLSEAELGESNPGSSSTVIGKPTANRGPSDSDLQLGSSLAAPGASDILKAPGASNVLNVPSASDIMKADSGLGLKKPDSDVKLVPSQGSVDQGSDVKLVAGSPVENRASLSDALKLEDEDSEFISDAPRQQEDDAISIVPVDDSSSLGLADDSDSVFEIEKKKGAPGSDLALPDDAVELSMGNALSLDDEPIPFADEGSKKGRRSESALDDDELVLRGGPGSDITINAGDSGISLADPADSGLSLEVPLDLDSVDEEPLSLAGEDMLSIADSDSEVATDMKSDSDFLLTPLEEVGEEDMDSGSQVIALDDSGFSDSGLGTGMDQMLVEEPTDGSSLVVDTLGSTPQLTAMTGVGMTAARPMVPDITFTTGNIVALGTCVFFLTLTGMMMFDLIKNMWSWDGPYALNSAMMDFVLGFF